MRIRCQNVICDVNGTDLQTKMRMGLILPDCTLRVLKTVQWLKEWVLE